MGSASAVAPELVLTNRPDPRRTWLAELWQHREILTVLTKKDFQTRYKRASLGIVWAVGVPVLQAAILAIVFSRVVTNNTGANYPVFVMAGVLCFSYFSSSVGAGSTSIVDNSSLTDKVWFPRIILPMVPCLSSLVGFGVTLVTLIVVMPIFHTPYSLRLLLIVPGTILLILLTMSLAVILSALHVYFRDVRYIVQAGLLVWIYVTPVLFPQELLGRLAPLMDANPLTGVVNVFHEATVGHTALLGPALYISLGMTAAFVAIGLEVQLRRDRLFVDLL